MIELIDDDDVCGHAISALRSYGPERSLPYLELARAKLGAVVRRPMASDFAKRQARSALERIWLPEPGGVGRFPPQMRYS